jgi:hypothetical protein
LNALLVGERRNRITSSLIEAFVADLKRLPVTVESSAPDIVFNATQALCRKHRLTAYDAAYLELALRDGYPLATADDDLKKAAIPHRFFRLSQTFSLSRLMLIRASAIKSLARSERGLRNGYSGILRNPHGIRTAMPTSLSRKTFWEIGYLRSGKSFPNETNAWQPTYWTSCPQLSRGG